MTEATVQPITSLPAGKAGTVVALDLPGDVRARLLELGLVVGTNVEIVRFAPLGDPVEIRFRGCNLSLRRHEADGILVETAP
jgi:ferrous iron transport protein A